MASTDEIACFEKALADLSRAVYRGIAEARNRDGIVKKKNDKIRRNMRITQNWVRKASHDAKEAKGVSTVVAATAKSAVQAALPEADEDDRDFAVPDEMIEEEIRKST